MSNCRNLVKLSLCAHPDIISGIVSGLLPHFLYLLSCILALSEKNTVFAKNDNTTKLLSTVAISSYSFQFQCI